MPTMAGLLSVAGPSTERGGADPEAGGDAAAVHLHLQQQTNRLDGLQDKCDPLWGECLTLDES